MNLQAAGSREDLPGDYHHMSVGNPLDTLEELCILLEDHAPSWYSGDTAQAGLGCPQTTHGGFGGSLRLWKTIVRAWYTEEQHNRAISVLRAMGVLDGAVDKQD